MQLLDIFRDCIPRNLTRPCRISQQKYVQLLRICRPTERRALYDHDKCARIRKSDLHGLFSYSLTIMSATFLVTGATGEQGGATARELLKAGARVHALVRDTSKPAAKELEALGVVLFPGDFADTSAIEKATAGVKGIFVRVQIIHCIVLKY